MFSFGVVALVENGVVGLLLAEGMVGAERVRDPTVTLDSDAKPVHVPDRPVRIDSRRLRRSLRPS